MNDLQRSGQCGRSVVPSKGSDENAFFDLLRLDGGIIFSPEFDAWLVVDAELVQRLLRSPAVSSAWSLLKPAKTPSAPMLDSALSQWFMLSDDPEHGELRRPLHRHFSARAVATLRPAIREQIGQMLDELGDHDVVDLVESYAVPVASAALATVLDLQVNDVRTAVRYLGPVAAYLANPFSDAVRKDGEHAMVNLSTTLLRAADGAKTGFFGELVGEADSASDASVATGSLLLFAGYETTKNMVALSLLNVLSHPSARATVLDGSVRIPDLVEELLRFATPAPRAPRAVVEDFDLRGHRLRRGDRIILYLDAANHDPVLNASPDEVVLAPGRHHVAFGGGRHFCLGAGLARIVGQEAIGSWLVRYAEAEIIPGGVTWHKTPGLRELQSVQVRMKAGR